MGPSVVLCLVETRLITRPTSAGPIWTIERISAYSAKTAANARRDSSRTLIGPASKGLDPCPSCEGAPKQRAINSLHTQLGRRLRGFLADRSDRGRPRAGQQLDAENEDERDEGQRCDLVQRGHA